MAPDRLDYALFDKVFIRPACMPLTIAFVEDAFANHAAAGSPLEKGRMSHFERFYILDKTVPASVPAGICRTATALEPGIIENTVTDFTPFGHRTIYGKAAALFHGYVFCPAVPSVVKDHAANPKVFCLFHVEGFNSTVLYRYNFLYIRAVDSRKLNSQGLIDRNGIVFYIADDYFI